MKQFEFAYLYYNRLGSGGSLYNFRTNEPLQHIKEDGGLPYVLQSLSKQGWQIIHSVENTSAGNDYDLVIWLQREVIE